MNYHQLAQAAARIGLKTLKEGMPEEMVLAACLYEPGNICHNSQTLYLVSSGHRLPPNPMQQPLSLLLYGALPPQMDLTGYSNVYHCLQEDHPALAQDLASILRDEQHYLKASERLTNALLSGAGMQHLLDEAHQVFQNPIMLVDSAYRYIAVSYSDLKDDSQFAQQLREELEHGFVLEEGIQYIRQIGLDQITRSRNEPYFMENEVLGARMYVSSVRIHNVDVAHLTLVEHSRPFSDVDQRCMARLVALVALEMQKNEFYATNKGQMYSYLLNDILESEQPSYDSIYRRMDTLNFKLGQTFYVVVIHSRKFDEPAHGLDYVTEQLSPILTGNIYARYQGSLVLLINLKQVKADISEYTLKALEDIAIKSRYSIGISNAFYDLGDTRRKYYQALRATVFGELNGDFSTLYYYKDYSLQDLLDIGKRSRNLLELCHPDIFKLMEYDRQNNAQLAHTLYYYLEIPHTPQKIAEKLHIHRNTFFYRLEKIRDLLQSDLKNGRELFLYHFSFMVLQFLGKFNPNPNEKI